MLPALIERLEKAEEGSRDLDARIALAVEYPEYTFPAEVLNRKPSDHEEAWARLTHDGFGNGGALPHYTTSLDSAMTLLPERRLWSVGTVIKATGYVACLDNQSKSWRGATPALALVIAIFRAVAA